MGLTLPVVSYNKLALPIGKALNEGATNESGFTALPGSMRDIAADFAYGDQIGIMWVFGPVLPLSIE